MALLVLKGGNAIDIAYDLSNRGSIDIDFSMDRDFTAAELNRVRNQAAGLLKSKAIVMTPFLQFYAYGAGL
jgi:predicted nucleotidyltransferase component of viral defense system